MEKSNEYYWQSRWDIVEYVPSNIKTILDIGCSEGLFLKAVKDKTGAETWGIEINPEISEKAEKNVDKVITGDIVLLIDSLPENYFDCVTFNDVLEHLIEPEMALKLIKTKLTRHGIVIASIPSVRYLPNVFELLVKKDWQYIESGILDYTHLRFFTKKSMIRLFENAGYSLSGQYGINKLKTWKFRLFNYLTLRILDDTLYLRYICITSPS